MNMCRENTKTQIENACLRIVFNTLWYYYCIARKVNLGLVICLRTQITLDYLYIAQGGYQSAIYQHTFSTAGVLDYLKLKTTLPDVSWQETQESCRITRVNPFIQPAAACKCMLQLVHSAHWTEKYLNSPDLESTPWSRINPDWQDSEVGLAISGDAR